MSYGSIAADSYRPGLLRSWRVAGVMIWIDIKQGFRKHAAASSRRDKILKLFGLLFGLSFITVLHLAAYSLLEYAAASFHKPLPNQHDVALIRGLSTAVWSFLVFVMISGGLVRAIVVLHEQDDSNLLLSSPVSPRAILAARLFGNALQSCLVDGFIIIPWIDVQIFLLHGPDGFWAPIYLWGYPVWFALAIMVTCVDGLFSFGLIRWLGMRRARFLSQAVPFILIFGVTFFAGSMSVSLAQMSQDAVRVGMPATLQEHFVQLSHTPLRWIARAATGNPLFLTMIFSAAAALAMITLRLTERAFVEGTQSLAENESSGSTHGGDFKFSANPFLLEVRKGLRLITRTPMMLIQCIAQVLTPVGIAFILARDDFGRAAAFFIIFVAGVLCGMFTIAAGTVEECDDLLLMSPRPPLLFRLGKMASGLLWPLGLALLVALGLFISGNALLALAVLLGGIPLGVTSSIVGETFAKPIKTGVRPKLLADPIMMIPLLGMQIISGLVAGVTVFAAAFSLPFLLLALLACYLIFVLAIGLAQLRKPLLSGEAARD